MKLKKQKLNQNGFAHLSLIIIVILSVAVVGLAGYRVNQARNASQKSTEVDTAKNEIENDTVQTEDEVEAIPEADLEDINPPKQDSTVTEPDKQDSQPEESVKARTVNFVKGGHSTDGDEVQITHLMSEELSGTCKFTFTLNGTVRVEKTKKISSSKSCSIKIAKSEFPKSAIYSQVTSFISNDGLVSAKTSPLDLEII